MNTIQKKIIATAITVGFASAAQAATSVTLYGIVDVGYGHNTETKSTAAWQTYTTTLNTGAPTVNLTGNATFDRGVSADDTDNNSITTPSTLTTALVPVPSSTTTNNRLKQNDGYHDDSRIGVKGQEDLGNGMSAIFKAEMRFKADTGSFDTQMADTYVGLKGSFGEVTVGRRTNITDDLFGYNSNAKEIDGLVGKTWNNSLSYRGSFGGLTVGADVTTGENQSGYITSPFPAFGGAPYVMVGGRAYQYAVGAEYSFGAGAVAAGYEHDKVGKHAYALGLKYKVGPVQMFGRVARATQTVNNFDLGAQDGVAGFYKPGFVAISGDNMDKQIRSLGWSAGLNYSITSNDVLGVSYSQLRTRTRTQYYDAYARATAPNYTDTNIIDRTQMLSLDYTHSMSKRTALYAGVSLSRTNTSVTEQLQSPVPANAGATEVLSYRSASSRSYNVGLIHKF